MQATASHLDGQAGKHILPQGDTREGSMVGSGM